MKQIHFKDKIMENIQLQVICSCTPRKHQLIPSHHAWLLFKLSSLTSVLSSRFPYSTKLVIDHGVENCVQKRKRSSTRVKWLAVFPLKDFKLDHCCDDISCFEIFSQRNGPQKGIQHALANCMMGEAFQVWGTNYSPFAFFFKVSTEWTFVFLTFGKFSSTSLHTFPKKDYFLYLFALRRMHSPENNFFSFRRILMVILILRLLPNFQNL